MRVTIRIITEKYYSGECGLIYEEDGELWIGFVWDGFMLSVLVWRSVYLKTSTVISVTTNNSRNMPHLAVILLLL